MSKQKFLIVLNVLIFLFGLDLFILQSKLQSRSQEEPPIQQQIIVKPAPEPPEPINYDIAKPVPEFLEYDALVTQMKVWESEAPELAEIGTYGKSSKGKDLYYLRVRNERLEGDKPVVLLTAATHGNEPWSTTTMMAVVGTILDKYGDDDKITELVDSRDIYLIPVVSPDTYPRSRYVDGVDPNRDYPTQKDPDKVSCAPIEALKQLTLKIGANAAISGHTSGRVYFYPYADTRQKTDNDADYQRILAEMRRLSGYGYEQGCYNYGRPIYGSEMDWYYRNGCLGIVMEFGSHQSPPSMEQVRSEFERTYEAILYFIEEAAEVKI